MFRKISLVMFFMALFGLFVTTSVFAMGRGIWVEETRGWTMTFTARGASMLSWSGTVVLTQRHGDPITGTFSRRENNTITITFDGNVFDAPFTYRHDRGGRWIGTGSNNNTQSWVQQR